MAEKEIWIRYCNHRGEIAWRHVMPIWLEFSDTPWHPGPQWIMHAKDLDKNAERSFAMVGILEWKTLCPEDEIKGWMPPPVARDLVARAEHAESELRQSESAIAAAVKAEREACADVAERIFDLYGQGNVIAKRIRARGK